MISKRFFRIFSAAWRAFKNADFISDKYVLGTIVLAAVINVALWYYLKHFLGPADSFKVTHYTFASGADLLGTASDIYALAYQAVLFSIANILIARLVYGYDIFMAYIIISVLPLLNGFIFLHGYLLVAVNG